MTEKRKVVFKVLGVTFLIPVLIILGYFGYFYFTYIHDTVTKGEGYGFVIGENKSEVFQRAKILFENEDIYYRPEQINKKGFLRVKMKFTKENQKEFSNFNLWKFYFGDQHIDHIDFKFENEKLVEIHRHRQYFELP